MAGTLYFMGDFEAALRIRDTWRSDLALGKCTVYKRAIKLLPVSTDAADGVQEVGASAVSVLCYEAQAKWHLGEIASSQTTVAEAISLAKEMNDMHGLAVALWHAAVFAYYEGNPAEVERLASKSIELSTRHHFAHWLPQGEVLRGWARSTSGDITEGISWIVDGIEEFRATGALRGVPFFLALKAEALQLADRTFEALEAIREAQGLVERSEERLWRADLHRLRGVLLTAMGADETQIEASFCEAIRTAREQKSIPLARRAEASYAEYRSKKQAGQVDAGFDYRFGSSSSSRPSYHLTADIRSATLQQVYRLRLVFDSSSCCHLFGHTLLFNFLLPNCCHLKCKASLCDFNISTKQIDLLDPVCAAFVVLRSTFILLGKSRQHSNSLAQRLELDMRIALRALTLQKVQEKPLRQILGIMR